MSLPPDVNTFNVHGKWVRLNGDAETGTVRFQPTITRLVDASSETVLVGEPIIASLDASGEIALSLPCTDDSDLTGTPFAYIVSVTLSNTAYSFVLLGPVATVGTIELAAYSSAAIPATPTSPFVVSIDGHSGVLSLANIGVLPLAGGTLTGQLVLAAGIPADGQNGTAAVLGGATPEKATDISIVSGGRALFVKTASTYDHASTFYLEGAQTLPSGGGGGYTPTQFNNSAVNIVSENYHMSTVQVSGSETGRGTIKVTHKGYADGSDSNASAISIDLQTVWNTPGDSTVPGGLKGTKSRAIFVTSTTDIGAAGVLGDALVVRFTTGLDDFRITGTGKAILGSPVGTTPKARLDVRALAGNTAVFIQQPITSGQALIVAADINGSTDDVIALKDNTGATAINVSYNGNLVSRRNTYAVGGLQVGGTSGTFGSGGIGITNTTAPGTPNGGVAIWAEGGVLKYKGTNGNTHLMGADQLGVIVPGDHGFVGWSYDPASAVNNFAIASGVLYLVKVKVPVTSTITNVVAYLATAGSGLTAGQCFAALFDSTGTRLGVTADQAAAWASAGSVVMPLTAPVVNVAPGTYYVALLSNGTTNPAFARSVGTNVINVGLSAPYRYSTSGSGQTTVPANVTLTSAGASGVALWAALS